MSAEIEIIPPSNHPAIVVQWTPFEGGGPSFLPAPSHLDDADFTYFFYGWNQLGTIRRQSRATGLLQNATGLFDFSTAWLNRVNLEYV